MLLRGMLKSLSIELILVHRLRHTHASTLLYRKVSIYYVSVKLGHKDIDTTLKYYAHIIKELRVREEKSIIATFESLIEEMCII